MLEEEPCTLDIADVNARLHDPLLVLHDSGLNADLVKLLQQLHSSRRLHLSWGSPRTCATRDRG